MQSKRTELKHEALASSLKVQLKYFQQKSPLDDVILDELQQFKKYLKFKLAQATYDEAQISTLNNWKLCDVPLWQKRYRILTTKRKRQRS